MQEWPIPTTLKQLRWFLDLTGYHKRFIKGFASLSSPLTQLLKKNAFKWTLEAQLSFEALKRAMMDAPVLGLPHFNDPFVIETDASGINGKLLRKGKIVVGQDESLRKELLQYFHEDCIRGHLGVMAFSVISISSDSSEESMWTSTDRVILFDTIPTTIPSIAPTTNLPIIHYDTLLPNGVLKVLTYMKSVGSLPTHRLVLRYSADYTSSDSHPDTSSHSSLRHSHQFHSYAELYLSCAQTLLPPHKKIMDSDFVTDFEVSSEEGYVPYVPREVALGVDVEDNYEPYTKPDVDSDIQENINACIEFADDLRARGMDVRVMVETMAEEEIPAHQIQVIESVQRDQRLASRVLLYQSATISERIGMLEQDNMRLKGICRTMPTTTRTEITQDAINEMIAKCVEEALKAYDAAKNLRTETNIENEKQDDNVDANGDNGNGNGNGNGNPNVNNKGVVAVARECTYQDFMKCQPLNFKGTVGVVDLTRWFESIATVFHISNCPPRYQVKYATCTMLDGALIWWNSYKMTVGFDDAYVITWQTLMKLMTEMVSEEEDKVEKYIGGLSDSIQRNVIAPEPVRLQDAVQLLTT
nr:retrovirus-related Pol polyprotein from transposon 17.6 [Tanacetum cinerariifolium]